MSQPRRVVSVTEGRALLKRAKPSKYKSRKTTVDGIVFDSAKEARRYQELRLLNKAGQIRNLHRQFDFELQTVGSDRRVHVVAYYIADFVYHERTAEGAWVRVVEDCKGYRTAMYRLKAKWLKLQDGITIRET